MWDALDEELLPIPDGLLCPVCQAFFDDPVATVDGHSYCRACITEWFDRHDRRASERKQCGQHLDARGDEVPFPLLAPMTQLALPSRVLQGNVALRRAVAAYKEGRPGWEMRERERRELRERLDELEGQRAHMLDEEHKTALVEELNRLRTRSTELEQQLLACNSELARLRALLAHVGIGSSPSSQGGGPEEMPTGLATSSHCMDRELRGRSHSDAKCWASASSSSAGPVGGSLAAPAAAAPDWRGSAARRASTPDCRSSGDGRACAVTPPRNAPDCQSAGDGRAGAVTPPRNTPDCRSSGDGRAGAVTPPRNTPECRSSGDGRIGNVTPPRTPPRTPPGGCALLEGDGHRSVSRGSGKPNQAATSSGVPVASPATSVWATPGADCLAATSPWATPERGARTPPRTPPRMRPERLDARPEAMGHIVSAPLMGAHRPGGDVPRGAGFVVGVAVGVSVEVAVSSSCAPSFVAPPQRTFTPPMESPQRTLTPPREVARSTVTPHAASPHCASPHDASPNGASPHGAFPYGASPFPGYGASPFLGAAAALHGVSPNRRGSSPNERLQQAPLQCAPCALNGALCQSSSVGVGPSRASAACHDITVPAGALLHNPYDASPPRVGQASVAAPHGAPGLALRSGADARGAVQRTPPRTPPHTPPRTPPRPRPPPGIGIAPALPFGALGGATASPRMDFFGSPLPAPRPAPLAVAVATPSSHRPHRHSLPAPGRGGCFAASDMSPWRHAAPPLVQPPRDAAAAAAASAAAATGAATGAAGLALPTRRSVTPPPVTTSQPSLRRELERDRATGERRPGSRSASRSLSLRREACLAGESGQAVDSPSPMHMAVRDGHLEVVRLLCETGCSLDAADAGGVTPLHVACHRGLLDIVRFLCCAGADKDIGDGSGASPLHIAACVGHLEVALLLCEAGGDKDRSDSRGATPLHVAAHMGHLEVVSCLLEAGCDARALAEGLTALAAASRQGHADVVHLLRKAEAWPRLAPRTTYVRAPIEA